MASNADKPTERIKRVRRTSKKIAAPGAEPVAAQETAAYEPSPAPPTAVSFLAKGTVRHHEITAFLRQTIMLLEAGTPILKTLHTLSERGERRGIRGLASDITQYV